MGWAELWTAPARQTGHREACGGGGGRGGGSNRVPSLLETKAQLVGDPRGSMASPGTHTACDVRSLALVIHDDSFVPAGFRIRVSYEKLSRMTGHLGLCEKAFRDRGHGQ